MRCARRAACWRNVPIRSRRLPKHWSTATVLWSLVPDGQVAEFATHLRRRNLPRADSLQQNQTIGASSLSSSLEVPLKLWINTLLRLVSAALLCRYFSLLPARFSALYLLLLDQSASLRLDAVVCPSSAGALLAGSSRIAGGKLGTACRLEVPQLATAHRSYCSLLTQELLSAFIPSCGVSTITMRPTDGALRHCCRLWSSPSWPIFNLIRVSAPILRGCFIIPLQF